MSTRPTVVRLEEARRHQARCELCEHRCGVDRAAGRLGVCRAGVTARVFKERVEYGEEAELIPSHLFYLSGCDLKCAFCIAEANAFDPRRGRPLTASLLDDALERSRAAGVRTLQWVGGEPTIHLPAILVAMAGCRQLPPVVWKSDFYATPEALRLLDGVVAVYLADFKFGNDVCATRIAGVERYIEVVTRNLQQATRQGDLIVRHLLLPGHFDCCVRPIVNWLATHLPDAKFSLRDGYLPAWQARRHHELDATIAPEHARAARTLAEDSGLRLVE